MLVEFAPSLHDQLGGGRGGGRADIGYEIRDREIRLMANSGNYRDRTCDNRASYSLFVEGPQVFDRAAAANEQNHIRSLLPAEVAECFDNLPRSVNSLDLHWIKREMHVRKTTHEDADHIANRRACR